VFAAGLMATTPLLAVLLLRDLRFPAWQYGFAIGLPCVGGVLFGVRVALLACGVIVAAGGRLLPWRTYSAPARIAAAAAG
jgi:hypothetical protein